MTVRILAKKCGVCGNNLVRVTFSRTCVYVVCPNAFAKTDKHKLQVDNESDKLVVARVNP